ncbi:hypothetical protein [Pseudofrankia inefficax]|uniref:Uncharacterized protein n=1 Tax=Pseudofrankia inefficax (strain DSM 45817 / CECT 9037 / DDB 130130 / EuI1c) TaxID=298654 RepID=E3IZF8_PSEI1|nr:hypothetical protein [Pseudofrankia inefficax]ADP82728.1 hypothetical protein FraEuI1c_4737 [Pseudofrankia inefficax]
MDPAWETIAVIAAASYALIVRDIRWKRRLRAAAGPPAGLSGSASSASPGTASATDETGRRARLFTATTALLGVVAGLLGHKAYGERLIEAETINNYFCNIALSVAAVLGALVALAVRRRVEGAVLVYVACVLVGGATLTFAIENAARSSRPAVWVPGCVNAFGLGLLVPAVLLATRRRWLVWIGALLVLGGCAPVALVNLAEQRAPDNPFGACVGPATVREDVPGVRVTSCERPDGSTSVDPIPGASLPVTLVPGERLEISLFGGLTLLAGLSGGADAAGAWAPARPPRVSRALTPGPPQRPGQPASSDGAGPDVIEADGRAARRRAGGFRAGAGR